MLKLCQRVLNGKRINKQKEENKENETEMLGIGAICEQFSTVFMPFTHPFYQY